MFHKDQFLNAVVTKKYCMDENVYESNVETDENSCYENAVIKKVNVGRLDEFY